jgi:hypothetical protein
MRLVIFLVGIVIAYAFYDAYATFRAPVSASVMTRAISWEEMYIDSMPDDQTHGTVYIEVRWNPDPDRVMANVRVSGSAWEGDRKLEDFDQLCQRANSTNLRRHRVPTNSFGNVINTDPVCFIRLRYEYPFDANKTRSSFHPDYEAIRRQVESVRLKDVQIEARMSSRPMKLVTWIEDTFYDLANWVHDSWNWVLETGLAPFQRA